MFYAGWLAVAPLGGALSWRPHVWITGPTGSGKSYVMQEMTYPLLQNFCQYFRGQTTEAGIRQKCGSSTLPIIFDEFETNDKHSGGRIRSILELARQASSDSDGTVAKGTVGGSALEFKPQFSMIVGSVRLNLVHVEDENRFAVLELSDPTLGDKKAQFDMLHSFVSKLNEEYGHRLFSRMVELAIPLRSSAKVFQDVIAEKYTMRAGQQYGTLLAGYWMLRSDVSVTVKEARSLCQALQFIQTAESNDRKDELECLDYLMSKVVRTNYGDRAILEMIKANADDSVSYCDALQRLGIKIESNLLCIASNNPELVKIYQDTKWEAGYAKQLSRIVGAEYNRPKRFKLHGKLIKCVLIPLTEIFSE
jgi:putative DNA primase/helicase